MSRSMAGRPLAILVAAVLAGGMLCGPADAAHRPGSGGAAGRHLTVRQALHRLVGARVANHRMHARTTIVGWHRVTRHGRRGYAARVRTVRTDYCRPHLPCRLAGGPVVTQIPAPRVGGKADWWNPVTWHWKDIMRASWRHVAKPCAKGTLSTVLGVKSTNVSARLLLKGGFIRRKVARRVVLGSEAVPAIALGGCLFGITSQLW